METTVRGWTLGEIAVALEGELHGPADLPITGPASAGSGGPSDLTFAAGGEFLSAAEKSDVGAVLAPIGLSCEKPYISVADPKAAFARFLRWCVRPLPLSSGIHSTAIVSSSAFVAESASVGAYSVIEAGASIGEGARIYPFTYVGERCFVGDEAVLYPHVVLYQDVRVGPGAILHSGTVIGADGFGYVWTGKLHSKVPQLGGVEIGADVEIGALVAVDRATLGDTVIGAGSKLDNHVQVAHNVQMGEHALIASQSGVAGSAVLGDRVTIGGQAGLADHVRVGDDVALSSRGGSTVDILEPGIYSGYPARPLVTARRIQSLEGRLPEMHRKLIELERRLAALESTEE